MKPPTRAVTRSRWLVFGCGTIPVLLAALLALYRPVAFAGLDAGVYDTVVRMTSTRQPAGRIVIIDVDERSLAKFGQWPWKRDLIALLVDTLRKDGAAVVALDIMIEARDLNDAIQVASRIPSARQGSVEVRPVVVFSQPV